MKAKRSFSSRLTRRVLITVLITMTVISVIVFLVSAAVLLMFTRAHFSEIMDNARGNMALVMSKVEVSADNIIDELSWHLNTPELVASTMQYELGVNRHLYGCGMAFVPDYYPKQGRWYEPYALSAEEIEVRDIGSADHDYFQSEWYKKGVVSQEGVWSNPYFDKEGGGTILCTYARAVMEPEGNVAGVFGADLSLENLSVLITADVDKANENDILYEISPDETDLLIYSFIIGSEGDYIVHPDKNRIIEANFYDYAVGDNADKYRRLGDAMRAGKSGEEIVEIDGIRAAVYYAPLLESGWSMAIVVPIKRLFMPGYIFATLIIFLILLGLLVVFWFCRRSIKESSKPLIKLAESAGEVAMGNFDTPLPEIKTDDEIRILRDSFDNMQKSLAEYVDELTETTARQASMERELGVARDIQMSMLPMTWPAFPERNDLDIFGSVTPAKAVGGDLYDFHLRDGKLFFCIGDVAGKGIPAALVMTEINSLFRTLSASEDSPARIISSINASRSLHNESLMFVTLFVGTLDLSTGKLQYANAGHNPPVTVSGGKAHMLEVDPNIPVGVAADWAYSQQELTLPAGTLFFLYTDGLTEATSATEELFGEDRVLEQLSGREENISAAGLIAHMMSAVKAFVGDAEQSDDLTMLALERLPETL